jgi:putative lipoic acid-binding regulatory protein
LYFSKAKLLAQRQHHLQFDFVYRIVKSIEAYSLHPPKDHQYMNSSFSFEALQEKLDSQFSWPSLYMFKFIVPSARVDEVISLFSRHNVQTKASQKGTYISVTAKIMANSSEEVIQLYKKAVTIEGIISL